MVPNALRWKHEVCRAQVSQSFTSVRIRDIFGLHTSKICLTTDNEDVPECAYLKHVWVLIFKTCLSMRARFIRNCAYSRNIWVNISKNALWLPRQTDYTTSTWLIRVHYGSILGPVFCLRPVMSQPCRDGQLCLLLYPVKPARQPSTDLVGKTTTNLA